ncbi:MAG: O-antigen ligase family protein [bacterium]
MASSLFDAASPQLVVLDRRSSGARFRPVIALQAAMLLLLTGNLVRVPLWAAAGRAVPLLVSDIAAVGLLGIGLVAAVHRRSLRLDTVALIGLAFATLGVVSALASVSQFGLTFRELGMALAQLARWLLYFGVYVVAINNIHERDVHAVWQALERCVLAFALFGIAQAAFLPGFAQLVYPESRPNVDWDMQGHRLVSTLLDPNYAGALILIALLVEVALLASGKKVAIWKPILLFAAIIITASRGSLLALIVGLGVIVLTRGRSKKLLWIMGVLVVGTALALPKLLQFGAAFNKLRLDDPSALARLVSWAHAWTVFRDHPLIGIGFNTWSVVQGRYGWQQAAGAVFGIDGGLIFIAVLTGIAGVTLYCVMIGAAVLRARSVWRNPLQSAEHRGLAVGAAAVSVALVVHSLFTNSLLLPFVMEPLWVLWALGFVMARSATRNTGSA